MKSNATSDFFQDQYQKHGFGAQRNYPNEELCRFMGRNFFDNPLEARSHISVLEVGCGSGSNLWMIAREGFRSIGIDISKVAIDLCRNKLDSDNCKADLIVGSMTDIPLTPSSVNVIVDIFSSHCLTKLEGQQFLSSVKRTLKPGGSFFSYFPSKNSDTWKLEIDSKECSSLFLDEDTLDGLHRKTGPYYGNFHPFRFMYPEQYEQLLLLHGLRVTRCETVNRTYRDQEELFEFVTVEAVKVE